MKIMKKEKIKIFGKFFLAFATLLFLTGFISAVGSTSSYSVQYTSPSFSNFDSSSYNSLISGINERSGESSDEEFFDMEVFIPPAGCSPQVVRSDLLEEQNVPVFCQLMPVKINPGVDINRLDRVSVSQKTKNEGIAGIGFHPANVAIKSKSSASSVPSFSNLGYVVVVLKKNSNEKSMPDNITATLSATLQYSADYAFGIGESEFYVPELSEEEFANTYDSYSFMDGLGYLRATDVDEKGATIEIYSAKNKRVFSSRIEKGKTSRDFTIPSETGGRSVRITLQDLAVPQIKAKIRINNEKEIEAYVGNTFYNGKCRLINIINNGLGSGKVTVRCGSQTFNLERRTNQVNLKVGDASNSRPYALKDFLLTDGKYHYYLVYANKFGDSKNYIIVAKFDSTKFSKDSDDITAVLPKLVSELDSKIRGKQNINEIKDIVQKYTYSVSDEKIVFELIEQGTSQNLIQFEDLIVKDDSLGPETINYFEKSLNAFDYVKDTFGGENYYGQTSAWPIYGSAALWNEYILADFLNQNSKKISILSRIENEYPTSKYKEKTASKLISELGILGDDEGASDYSSKEGINIELVSITEPSESDSGVVLTSYVDGKQDKITTVYHENDVISTHEDYTVKLVSFDEDSAKFSCEYRINIKSNEFKKEEQTINLGKNLDLKNCRTKIFLENINLKRVAHITLTPKVSGRSRETNFTFSIGIEKRAAALNLTPAEANATMDSINRQISDLKNLTEALNETIYTGKLACLGTSLALNLKTLLAGTSGTATARKEVMQRWYSICAAKDQLEKYKTVDECIGQRYDADIKPEIEATTKAMASYNKKYKEQSANAKDKNGVINQSKVKIEIYSQVKNSPLTLVDEKGNFVSTQEKASMEKIASNPQNMRYLSNTEVATLYFDIEMMNDPSLKDESKKQYQKDAYNKLKYIESKINEEKKLVEQTAEAGGFKVSTPVETKNRDKFEYLGERYSGNNVNLFVLGEGVVIPSDAKLAIADKKLFVLEGKQTLTPLNVYNVGDLDSSGKRTVTKITSIKKGETADEIMRSYIFEEYNELAYKNACKDCDYVKVFTNEPYRNQPSLLPFDFDNGWYIQIKQNLANLGSLGTGEKKSYLDSGAVNIFWLCNVGKDGTIEGVGIGDSDICRRFDKYTGDSMDSFPGLTKEQTKTKVAEANRALSSAQSQLSSGNAKTIKINGRVLKVIPFNGEDVGSRCTDFMSPGECQLMYNVCDPFVCPSSRCNLGGIYQVDNVIQSGIIGSTVLCLPNFIAFKKTTGVAIPVCLTGIYAGLNSYISILEAYRDCINESTYGNKTVGICDYVSSIYICNFFWNQAGSYVTTLFKNLFLFIKGEGGSDSGGGGEYMFVNDAWNNAEKSSQVLQTTYAKDSKLTFGTSSLADTVAAEVCKSSASATYPNKWDTMLEPENPVQYQAWFSEDSYTSATLTPKSQYKVYYHIYSGTDAGHYYRVYLKSSSASATKSSTVVATGYVQKGATATETKDFIDDSGFNELCISIDNSEKCGFKSISSSFALNYVKDKVTQSQATETVTSESSCVNGDNNLGSLATLNIQQGVTEYVNPEIYNSGIIRVCSSANPGSTTEPSRWKDVGYCTDRNVRCWLDTNSVEKAIKGLGIENQTLSEIENISIQNLIATQGYLNSKDAANAIEDLRKVYDQIVKSINSKDAIFSTEYKGSLVDWNKVAYEGTKLSNLEEDVRLLDKKIIYSSQRAELWFFKAEVYSRIAENLKEVKEGITPEKTQVATEKQASASISVDKKTILLVNTDSEEFELDVKPNTIEFKGTVIASVANNRITVKPNLVLDYNLISMENQKFILNQIDTKNLNDFKISS